MKLGPVKETVYAVDKNNDALKCTVMNLLVHKNARNFLANYVNIPFYGGTLFRGAHYISERWQAVWAQNYG
jgi:hypothetical protein